jgi:hypothetical protein
MSFAANAVTDLVAPTPAPQSAAARDDDRARFQDHLDAHPAPNADADDHATRAKTNAKPSKPAKPESSNQAETQPAEGAARAADADESQQTHAPDEAAKPAHLVMVQVLPEASAQTPTPPTSTAAQQRVASQQSALTQSHAAQQAAASSPAQTADAPPQPAQNVATQNTSAQKPSKADGKANKSANTAPQTPQQAEPQQTAPAPATPVTPVATATNATTSTATDGAAVGAVGANNERTAAPADQTPAHGSPQAVPNANTPAADAAKGDESKANAVRAGKAANVVAGTKTAAAASAPDFKDLLRAASATPGESNASNTASVGTSGSTQAAAADPATTDLAATRAAAAPVASQVAREIVRRAHGDNTRFELRLDPAELGKIQVRLDVSRDHKVTAVITADNPQALSELSRGARDLQQALQSAGLDLADDGLSFDLSNSHNGFSQPDQSNTGGTANASARGQTAQNQTTADTSTSRARPLSIESWRGSRIDVMA